METRPYLESLCDPWRLIWRSDFKDCHRFVVVKLSLNHSSHCLRSCLSCVVEIEIISILSLGSMVAQRISVNSER